MALTVVPRVPVEGCLVRPTLPFCHRGLLGVVLKGISVVVANVRTGCIETWKWATDPVEAKAWEGDTMFFGSKAKDRVPSTHFGWIALR